MGKIRQYISNSQVRGKAKQAVSGSDLEDVEQGVEASEVDAGTQQSVHQDTNRLDLRARSASGRTAVIALAVVAILGLVAYVLPKLLP